MRFKKQSFSLIVVSIMLLAVFIVDKGVEDESSSYDLMIGGLVDHPLNFTYSELQRLPMVSEVAAVRCVSGWTEIYNWTGVPLFLLLSVTGVKANATEVVFYASDGWSSSLIIERALHPTTLIALEANGTVLSHDNGYPYRLVAPCKYGYVWIKWITKIEVVDYDYKGTFEGTFPSDDLPYCALPPTTPSFEDKNVDLGYTSYNITILSNSTINSFDFDIPQERVYFNVTGMPSTKGYCYVIVPRKLLWCDSPEEWQVWVDNTLIEDKEVIQVARSTYLYFTYSHPIQTIQIIGTHAISPHDIGITGLGTSKRVVGQNFPLCINMTIFNYGKFLETFNVNIYANMTPIASQPVTLASQNFTTVALEWNTSGSVRGNYTISAYAWPVPDEIDFDDNNCTDGVVTVTIPGDINGDGTVFWEDLLSLALGYQTSQGDPYYVPEADINGDGTIFYQDLLILALNYQKTDP